MSGWYEEVVNPSYLVPYRAQRKNHGKYSEEERSSSKPDDSTGLILEAKEYHGYGKDLARSECGYDYVRIDCSWAQKVLRQGPFKKSCNNQVGPDCCGGCVVHLSHNK